MSRCSSTPGTAVITGAAGGLGQAFAKRLAQRGYQLLLIDRRQPQLDEVRASLVSSYGIAIETMVVDFCNRQEVDELAQRLEKRTDVDVLVNNAGFGSLSHFVDTPPEVVMRMVDVHVVAPMRLTHAVLPCMLQRDRGAIINVSSISAWFHSAGNTHYGSTKICLAVFTAALNEELRGTNVCVQALCPGFVRTQFHDAEHMKEFSRFLPPARMWAVADDVAEYSLRRLSRKHVVAIPGFGYRVIGRLAQMPLLQPLMRRITRVPRSMTNAPVSSVQSLPDPVLSIGGTN